MVLILCILFCSFFITSIIKRRILIQTSTMAVCMALGILTQGVLLHFLGTSFIKTSVAHLLLAFILALWISYWFSILSSIILGKWKELHYFNPINRFGIGTWVAATSISGILIAKHFPQIEFIAQALAFLNAALWLFYIVISVNALIMIKKTGLTNNVHGILLLTTVSTQSIILMFHTVFEKIPHLFTTGLLTVGFIFYLLSLLLILKRYTASTWSVERDWNNTNCILHGALSISGMASIVSGVANESSQLFLWISTALVFLIVEAIELYRLFRLVKNVGWRKGVGRYDVSQWSRVFTFAMFYTFTVSIPAANQAVSGIQGFVGQVGVWVILVLVFIEVIVVLQHFLQISNDKQSLRRSG